MESNVNIAALRWREALHPQAIVQMLEVEALQWSYIVHLGKILSSLLACVMLYHLRNEPSRTCMKL